MHGHDDEIELTPEEREAFAALPREREGSDLLEERVVRAVRAEGIIGETGRGRSRPSRLFRQGWAWAAGLALFLGGGAVGHQVGARTTADVFLAVREQDAALQVQEAGTAYVRSLAALVAIRDEHAQADVVGQGTQAATATLHAAASVLARLDPDDPLTPMLKQLLEERREGSSSTTGPVQQTIWF